MIYCPQCGTPNKPSSKFCKNCAALLQPSTDVRCPICGTMNLQNAEACKSCGTRLKTSAAGANTSDQTTPVDAPENIAPFNPPELNLEADAPADKPPPARARAAFSQSNSQWLRRISKTPAPETGMPEPTPLSPAAGTTGATEISPADDSLKQPDAAPTPAENPVPADNPAPAPADNPAPKPQLSEIKLTGDNYDYSDIGGQVTDDMKAQLEAEAGNVQSVEDEVALAMRLLGLAGAGEAVARTSTGTAFESDTSMPAPVEPLAQNGPEAGAPTLPVVTEPTATITAPAPQEPIAVSIPPTETAAFDEAAPHAKPQLSEIKLTGDDYDYSDVPGQVTDEMKAQLQAEAGNVQSVDDEVALAMRLLGLSAGAAAVSEFSSSAAVTAPAPPSSDEPIASGIVEQEPVEAKATAAVAQEPVSEIKAPAPVGAVESREEKLAPPAAETIAVEQENPEWVSRLAAASSLAVAAKLVSDARAEPAETQTTEPAAEEIAQVPAAETPRESVPAEPGTTETAITGQGDVPEWLREIAPPEVVEADAAAFEEGMPEWVQELAPGAAVVGTTALLSHLPDLDESEREDLPDWLREPVAAPDAELAEPTAEAEPLTTEAGPAAQSPVELPPWMRGAAAAGRDPFELVETSGPLAGVSGILPLAVALTEPHTLSAATPPRTDSGRIFQTLLAEPLAAAATAEPEARAGRRFTSKHLLYLLIFLSALLALFLPSGADELGLLGKNVAVSPSAVFYDQLNALPAQSTVLMAFDYIPGQGPELDPAARAILETIAAHKVNVIALSSNPNGAAMAQSLLDRVKQAHPDLTFVNLGYIPGNESGLKSLALGWLPSNYVDANGAPWSQSPLSKTVRGMDDLALSVLILGEYSGLNAWMTQVQPIVKSPMIAATTAALEPQARIYVNSKQLNASLRGLTGAAELELWSGNSGRAVKTVNALSFVSLVLAGIIIATNLIWLVRRGKK